MPLSPATDPAYALARERYAALGVNVGEALGRLGRVAVSLHCWQGDDVAGFESLGEAIGGGLAVTGSYPGRARDPGELRSDLERALSLIPGRHRLNLHASYAETGGRQVARDELRLEHFEGWTDWARSQGIGMDFNPTLFAHPLANSGYTLAHNDPGVRSFWVRHCQACREIGASFGRVLGSPCVTNVWIPDGSKDLPIDRKGPRERLTRALDDVFDVPNDPALSLDAVEGKLFGLGSEAYVVGSHEFYLGYAITRRKLLCLDAGHFHPTETLTDKLSAVLGYLDGVLLHASRGVRWDSDHVVTFTDDIQALAQEVVRNDYLGRVRLGLDFFDASINRVAAWVIGTRALLKALLVALLEPTELLRRYEREGDTTGRLALLEELKSYPFGAVWDYHCQAQGVPVGTAWLDEVRAYERDTLSRRV